MFQKLPPEGMLQVKHLTHKLAGYTVLRCTLCHHASIVRALLLWCIHAGSAAVPQKPWKMLAQAPAPVAATQTCRMPGGPAVLCCVALRVNVSQLASAAETLPRAPALSVRAPAHAPALLTRVWPRMHHLTPQLSHLDHPSVNDAQIRAGSRSSAWCKGCTLPSLAFRCSDNTIAATTLQNALPKVSF